MNSASDARANFDYEDFDATPKRFSPALADTVRRLTETGWERWGHRLHSIRPPIPWRGTRGSFDYALHAFDPINVVLRLFSYTRDSEIFCLARDFVLDWCHACYDAEFDARPEACIARILADKHRTVWYDMAVGLRLYRLAYVLSTGRHLNHLSDDDADLLNRAILFHHDLLSHDDFFAAHSNHGVYQALGQLAAARRLKHDPRHARYAPLAATRTAMLFDRQFADDGGQLEHSPAYHYMVLGSFSGAVRSRLFDDATSMVRRIRAAQTVLLWMTKPSGMLAEMGDTDPRLMRFERDGSATGAEAMAGTQPDGPCPRPPGGGVAALPTSGYAFARLRAPDALPGPGGDSYLAQIAGFHSRVHKHADHLAFLWYDRGRDILIDPGRYAYAGKTEPGSDLFEQGFWYADPKRIYVESTRAHNCVEIDGRSHRRKGVRPFGSALRYAGEQDGLAVTDCEMVVERRVRHRRVLVMAPGHWLLVLDWLHDRTASHDFRQWFQFAPDWTLRRDDGIIRGEAPATDTAPAAALILTDLLDGGRIASPVRGQETPELQGWMSDAPYSLVPSTSVALDAPRTAMGRFATLIVLEPAIDVDRRATRFNATLRNGKVAWRDSRGSHALNVTLGEPGTVGVQRVIR